LSTAVNSGPPCSSTVRAWSRWRIERRAKRESLWSGAFAAQVLQAVQRLGYRRDVARRDPPQDQEWLGHRPEPLPAAAQKIEVLRTIHEVPQRFAGRPHGEVDDQGVATRPLTRAVLTAGTGQPLPASQVR
jgi:hypothetical protein